MYWSPILSIVFAVAVITALWLLNLPRRTRYCQFWAPVLAFVYLGLVLWFYTYPWAALSNIFTQLKIHLVNLLDPLITVSAYSAQDLPLVTNFLLLVGFLALKAVVQMGWGITISIKKIINWFKKKALANPPHPKYTPAYEFDTEVDAYSLKDSWVYPAQIFSYMAGFAFCIFLVCIVFRFLPQIPGDALFLPTYPAAALLLFLELSWYLGGPRLIGKKEVFLGNDVSSRLAGACDNLWAGYQNIWKDKVLAADKQDGKQSEMLSELNSAAGSTSSPGIEDQVSEVKTVWMNCYHLNIPLDAVQASILGHLWTGQDVMVTETAYHGISPVLFARIQKALFHRQHVLLLAPNTGTKDGYAELQQWIERWLNQPLFVDLPYKIATLHQFPQEANILIASVSELGFFGFQANKGWFKDVQVVVVVNVPGTLFGDISLVPAIYEVLSDLSRYQLQKIMLSPEDRKNMEPAVKACLDIAPVEFHMPQVLPNELCYIVWRTDEGRRFQDAVLNSSPRYIGPALSLMLLSLYERIESIHYCYSEQEPWKEYSEEMDQAVDKNIRKSMDCIVYHAMPYLASPQSRIMGVVHDSTQNLIVALNRVAVLGTDGAFVHVVSPPYLLRDYFADNIDFFRKHMAVEPLGVFASKLMSDQMSGAFSLFARLMHSKLPEGEIAAQIDNIHSSLQKTSDNGKDYQPLSDKLIKLFHDTFRVNIQDNLKQIQAYCFDQNKRRFQLINQYTFERGIDPGRLDSLDVFYTIVDGHDYENRLGIILEDHLYQNYLPGQMFSLYGKPYEVESVDHEFRRVMVAACTQNEEKYYRQVNSIVLHDLNEALKPQAEGRPGFWITQSFYHSRFEIKTEKYYEFNKGLSFQSGYAEQSTEEVPPRQYQYGRVSSISIQTEETVENHAAVSKTLALLLKELFLTVFPHSHQYIQVTTPFRNEISSNDNSVDKSLELVPLVTGDSQITTLTEKPEIRLLFFEDSTLDLGLVKAVQENWEDIFELLEDYLSWYLKNHDGVYTGFLSFGLEAIPEWITLTECQAFLSALLNELKTTTIKQKRLRFYDNEEGFFADPKNRRCDFCGSPLSPLSYEVLKYGRERCTRCLQTAVNTLEELKRVYSEGRSWMIQTYQLPKLRKNITVTFADASHIANVSGNRFIPTASFDPRIVGIAIKEGRQFQILLENGQPYHLTLATIVHELTHIWQYEHVDYERMIQEMGPLLIEGHSKYVELACLEDKNLGHNYSAREKTRQDEYGQGYRLIEQELKKHDAINDPFELLLKRYPV